MHGCEVSLGLRLWFLVLIGFEYPFLLYKMVDWFVRERKDCNPRGSELLFISCCW